MHSNDKAQRSTYAQSGDRKDGNFQPYYYSVTNDNTAKPPSWKEMELKFIESLVSNEFRIPNNNITSNILSFHLRFNDSFCANTDKGIFYVNTNEGINERDTPTTAIIKWNNCVNIDSRYLVKESLQNCSRNNGINSISNVGLFRRFHFPKNPFSGILEIDDNRNFNNDQTSFLNGKYQIIAKTDNDNNTSVTEYERSKLDENIQNFPDQTELKTSYEKQKGFEACHAKLNPSRMYSNALNTCPNFALPYQNDQNGIHICAVPTMLDVSNNNIQNIINVSKKHINDVHSMNLIVICDAEDILNNNELYHDLDIDVRLAKSLLEDNNFEKKKMMYDMSLNQSEIIYEAPVQQSVQKKIYMYRGTMLNFKSDYVMVFVINRQNRKRKGDTDTRPSKRVHFDMNSPIVSETNIDINSETDSLFYSETDSLFDSESDSQSLVDSQSLDSENDSQYQSETESETNSDSSYYPSSSDESSSCSDLSSLCESDDEICQQKTS
jgi:hypothetical protein